jgi:Dehydrogenase E1 component
VDDKKRIDNPIVRFRLFMESRGWWSSDEEEELKARLKKDVMNAFKHAEGLKRHELKELFTDVYGGEEPWNIVRCLLTLDILRWMLKIKAEGTKRRAGGAREEIRRNLGAMAF